MPGGGKGAVQRAGVPGGGKGAVGPADVPGGGQGVAFRGVPAQGDGAGIGISPAQVQRLFAPDAQIAGTDLTPTRGARCQVEVLGKGSHIRDAGFPVLVHVNGFGQPVTCMAMVHEHFSQLLPVPHRGIQESADIRFGNGHLVLPAQQLSQVEEIDARSPEIRPSPYAVKLAVVGSPYIDPCHKPVESFSKTDPVELAHALVGRDIGIVGALQCQVINIGQRGTHPARLVLPVTRRNGNDRADIEIEIKHLVGIVGIIRQSVEQRRMGHRLATPRMTNQGNPVHIHFFVKGGVLPSIPFLPDLQVFEQQPAAHVVLRAEPFENIVMGTVQKILIDRCQNIPPGSQQLAEVFVPRIGEILGQVVPVHDQHQRERTFALRIPYTGVER